jgi:hypothetical protein
MLWLLPVATWADGVVIPKVAAPVRINLPQQCALICWSNGVERLAIQTQFSAEGTNFAWVIPLPAAPVIEEATTGMFTTLEYIFRPEIVHNVLPLYLLLLIGAGLVYLLFTVRRNTPARISDTVVSLGVALAVFPLSACIALPLAFFLPYAAWRVRAGQESVSAILAAFLTILILGGLMLPALSAGRVAVVSPTGVSVLSRTTIGVYDTTTISAEDPEALSAWLQDNGYVLPGAANRVVSNYVHRGWVFVAAKLSRDSVTNQLNSPHPLCFTFPAKQAVYPLQLTGLASTNLEVQLFVFGPSRAEARFFHAERCAGTTFQKPADSIYSYRIKEIPIAHPLLREWAVGSRVATALAARLNPEEMADDIEIDWVPFIETQRRIYSNQGAAIYGLNSGVGIFVVALLLASIGAAVKPDSRRQWHQLTAGAAVIGMMVAGLVFISLPRMPVRLTRSPILRSRVYTRELELCLSMAQETNHFSSLADARAVVKSAENEYPELTRENFLLGGPVHEEDSPGNYTFRENTNGVQLIWYDSNGAEHFEDR